MNAVEKELLKATGAKAQAKGETRQAFLTRLGKSVNDLGEDDYEALSDEVVTWYEGAVKAAKSKKELPDFEEPEAETEAEDTADDPEVEEPEAGKKEKPKGKGKASVKKSPKAPIKKEKEKAPAKKLPEKKVAKAKAAEGPSGEGYKGHRPGTMKEKAHKLCDEMVAKKKNRATILAAIEKLGTAKSTAASWYHSFTA